jgi:hypothetical protein
VGKQCGEHPRGRGRGYRGKGQLEGTRHLQAGTLRLMLHQLLMLHPGGILMHSLMNGRGRGGGAAARGWAQRGGKGGGGRPTRTIE